MAPEQQSLTSQVAQYWSDAFIATHSQSCWQWHPRCAIRLLSDEVELLEKQLAEKNVIVQKLLDALGAQPNE